MNASPLPLHASWSARLRDHLAQAASAPAGADRVEAAANVVRNALLGRSDDVAIAQIKAEASRLRLLGKREVDAIVRESRRLGVLADGDQLAAAPEASSPPHEVPVPSGQWRYAEGAAADLPEALARPCAECAALAVPRGVYHRQREGEPWRLLGPLPWCHARIVHRDASGARTGMSYLLSAAQDSPPLILGHVKIKDGTWANELGVPLPDARQVIEAAGTAIRHLAEHAPEREAVARMTPEGRVAVPPVECLPAGYLACAPGVTRAEALARWADVASIASRNGGLADALGASAAAHMVRSLRVYPHVLDMYGDADRGKSTALRLCAGVWGDSTSDDGGTFQVWNTAPVATLRFLGMLGVLPAFMDEGGMSGFKPEDWGNLIYRITGGVSRQASEYRGDGVKRSLPWHGIMFVTGNARITNGITSGKWSGIPKRVNESPAPFTNDADMAEALDSLITTCYGHLGAEILTRFDVNDFRPRFDASAEVIETPGGGVPRTWARQLRLHYVGACLIDELCGTGGLLARAQADYAAAYLAENCREPEHDADILLAALIEAQAREPSRWPTVAEYRANRSARDYSTGGELAEGARHGVDKTIAGVRADAGEWFAVFPSVLDELVERAALDESRALRELHTRGALLVPEAARRRGHFSALVRLMPKPAAAQRMYKLAVPADDAAAADQGARPELPESPSPEPLAPPPSPESPSPELPESPSPEPLAAPPAQLAASESEALDWAPWEVGACAKCHAPTPRYGPRGRPFCAVCSAPASGDPRPTSAVGKEPLPAPAARPAPAPPPSPEARPLPFLVLGDGHAFGPDGEMVGAPALAELVASCSHVGDLAGVALGLGVRRLYVPALVREALGLPAELPEGLGKREGMPHPFAEAPADAWDVWPAEPVGLAPWMNVYRVPRSGEGADIAFAEYLAPVGDAPRFGDLPPDQLADALTMIWRASTYSGGPRGGAHYYRSPASWFGRVVGTAARRSRAGTPEHAAELPPPFTARASRGAPPLVIPSGNYAAPAEVPPGYVLAHLDVRSCFASAARSTPVGYGPPRKIRPGELSKLPGVHLARVPADQAEIAPGLFRWFPMAASARQREVGAWLDTSAVAWLVEQLGAGVVRLDESWVYPEGRRLFDSPIARMIEARRRLDAIGTPPARLAAAVVKAGPNRYLGGWLGSTFGGERSPDDWRANRAAWLAVRAQAETRKQRNLLPMIRAGVIVLGGAQLDAVYVAAPSIEALAAAPGTGARPAIGGGAGKFRIEALGLVTPALAEALARPKVPYTARLSAIRDALADQADGAEVKGAANE